MISKKEFVDIINRLRDYDDLQKKINKLFEENIDNEENDFMNAGSICIGHESVVAKLLQHLFDDFEIIPWWLYECNYGRNFKIGYIQEYEKDIDLSTAEKLYDYLIEKQRSDFKICKKG